MDAAQTVLQAIINLEGSKDFEVVVRWLSDSHSVFLKESSELTDEVKLRWWQGKAQCLASQLSVIINARSLMQRVKQR